MGTAIIALPLQQQVPLLVGSSLLKWLQARRRRRSENGAAVEIAPVNGTTLEWAHVTCELKEKGGNTRTLLDELQGRALPGRCASRRTCLRPQDRNPARMRPKMP